MTQLFQKFCSAGRWPLGRKLKSILKIGRPAHGGEACGPAVADYAEQELGVVKEWSHRRQSVVRAATESP